MKTDEFFKKIREKAKQNKLNREDLRFRKTIALLKGKGLLDTNLPIKPATGIKVRLDDVLWAGKNVEPRILEVLPAALLHFRSNFLDANQLPAELDKVLKEIRNNAEDGPALGNIPFAKMKHWANAKLKDKRTKPIKDQKVPKYFKIHMQYLNKIEALVESGKYKDQTSAIEAAISKL